MAIPSELLPTTCDVYRPFGAGAPTYTNVPCRLVGDFARGRQAAVGAPEWTHYIELAHDADVRDGCTRLGGVAAIAYADGDEIRVPSGATTSYVVVWVEKVDSGTPREFKRAYLLRNTA
jgi:hypothetical protein